jgi:hypothetical protein
MAANVHATAKQKATKERSGMVLNISCRAFQELIRTPVSRHYFIRL